ncbi:MAG TPA: MarR family winged helix-turn-helix transcriptional regulator [Actinophytocola sp.]|uniref:MarR family winged helix-turn-helix transcriptional regulator n=1 Tax=Actinophytocola sp. TaxID=1872138 RepID=UPI002DB9876E|nr:MarR family winged helix-turn-helix transcriptional regulator [Actinophytocola sp.]HEU5473092.1 MarR family winged helix-turn-helix transcriptional regulator [Actinophytocola sp.]
MHRPIGYWLKEIDRRIEADFARLLAAERLTRRHWQVLNTLASGESDIEAALAPFRSAAEPTMAPVLADLAARGWVDGTTLTADGRRAHADLAERVQASRLRLTEGISAEEYATVLAVLERMAGNLGRA